MNINDIFTIEQYDEAYQFVSSHEYTTIEDLGDGKYQIIDIKPTPEEEEQAEKERISHLKCTKRVFALGLQEYGLTYTRLKELIATNEQAQLEWDLCVELERNNPLLDIMGAELGITPVQLDNIFRLANGEEITNADTTDTDTTTISDEVQPESDKLL